MGDPCGGHKVNCTGSVGHHTTQPITVTGQAARVGMYVCMVCMYVCMYGWMDGWMDGWILTVDSLPVRGPDPGTPPAGRGGHRAAHTHAPDPTRTHCKQAPQTASSLVCTNPACSTNQQAGCKQGAVGQPPPPRRAAHKKRHQNMWRFRTPRSTSK